MFKYFHLCTHEKKKDNDIGDRRIIRVLNDGTDIDILIRGATILKIEEVRVISYKEELDRREMVYDQASGEFTYEDDDEDEGYYDDPAKNFLRFSEYFPEGAVISSPLPAYSYEPYVHNRMKWNVEPPTEYEVTVIVRFPEGRREKYQQSDCPQCQSKGWFVDIVDNEGRFERDTGIHKITQRIIKDLLTELYSNKMNLEYGTLLKQTLGTAVIDDEALFDDIRMIISEIEDMYLARQTENISVLEPEERLRACTVSKIQRSPFKKLSIMIELKIQTELEDGNFQFVV